MVDQREGVAYKMTNEVKDFILKEKMRDGLKSGTGEVKKVNKDILIDMEHRYPPKRAFIPAGTCNLYNINEHDHICLLIKEVIHSKKVFK